MGCSASNPVVIPNFFDEGIEIKTVKLYINNNNIKSQEGGSQQNSSRGQPSSNNNVMKPSVRPIGQSAVNGRHARQSIGSVGMSYCSEECDNPEVYDWLTNESPRDSTTSQEREAQENAKKNSTIACEINDSTVHAKLKRHVTIDKPMEQTNLLKLQVDQSGNRHINQYKIIKKLGSGAHGKVELCEDPSKNMYAVKILNKSIKTGHTDPTANECLMKEIAIMKKLNHPNVVRLYEVIDDPRSNQVYLILEYVEGGVALPESTVKCRPLETKTAWSYFRDIIQGLTYLHQQGIVHGDIKPSNLLVTNSGKVKISDFGEAQQTIVGGGRKNNNNGNNSSNNNNRFLHGIDDNNSYYYYNNNKLNGSPAFMAPELWNESASMSPLSDIWAMGVSLYYFLFGQPPFIGNNQMELFQAIHSKSPEFPIGTDPDLIDLINKLLTKEKENRMTLDQARVHKWTTKCGINPLIYTNKHKLILTDDEVNNAVTLDHWKVRELLHNGLEKWIRNSRSHIQQQQLLQQQQQNGRKRAAIDSTITRPSGLLKQLFKPDENSKDIFGINDDFSLQINQQQQSGEQQQEGPPPPPFPSSSNSTINSTNYSSSTTTTTNTSNSDLIMDEEISSESKSDRKKARAQRFNSYVDCVRQTAKGKENRKSAGEIPSSSCSNSNTPTQRPRCGTSISIINPTDLIETAFEEQMRKFYEIPKGKGERSKFLLQIMRERSEKREKKKGKNLIRHGSIRVRLSNSSDCKNLTNELTGSHLKRSSSAGRFDNHKALKRTSRAQRSASSLSDNDSESDYELENLSGGDLFMEDLVDSLLVNRKVSKYKGVIPKTVNVSTTMCNESLMIKVATCAIKGPPNYMEDRHLCILDYNNYTKQVSTEQGLFAVFDGHNGSECAEFLCKNFPRILMEQNNFMKNTLNALTNTFIQIDKEWINYSVNDLDINLYKKLVSKYEEGFNNRKKNENSCRNSFLKKCNSSSMSPMNYDLYGCKSMEVISPLHSLSINNLNNNNNNNNPTSPLNHLINNNNNNNNTSNNNMNGNKSRRVSIADSSSRSQSANVILKSGENNNNSNTNNNNNNNNCNNNNVNSNNSNSLNNNILLMSGDSVNPTVITVQQQQHSHQQQHSNNSSSVLTLERCLNHMENLIKQAHIDYSGSTGAVVLLRQSTLYIAHSGDSRVVLCRNGEAVDLTKDHKPFLPDEKLRIESAGGWVTNNRLNGILGVSRGFGDIEYKLLKEKCWRKRFLDDPLTVKPDVSEEILINDDVFCVLASDGLYDSMTSQEVVNFILEKINETNDLQNACDSLIQEALGRGSNDNITAIIIFFDHSKLNQDLDFDI